MQQGAPLRLSWPPRLRGRRGLTGHWPRPRLERRADESPSPSHGGDRQQKSVPLPQPRLLADPMIVALVLARLQMLPPWPAPPLPPAPPAPPRIALLLSATDESMMPTLTEAARFRCIRPRVPRAWNA